MKEIRNYHTNETLPTVYIGQFVIFDSVRYGFAGRGLGKIIAVDGSYILIERIDISNDVDHYIRQLEDDITLITSDQAFLIRLEF